MPKTARAVPPPLELEELPPQLISMAHVKTRVVKDNDKTNLRIVLISPLSGLGASHAF